MQRPNNRGMGMQIMVHPLYIAIKNDSYRNFVEKCKDIQTEGSNMKKTYLCIMTGRKWTRMTAGRINGADFSLSL